MLPQTAVTNLGHPSGTSEMAIERMLGAVGFLARIDAEDDLAHFILFRAIGARIKKPEIDDKVPSIIVGQVIRPGRIVHDGRAIDSLLRHRTLCN